MFVELKDLRKHLKTIKNEDWQLLFDTIPIIEQTEEFGKVEGGDLLENGSRTFPHWRSPAIVMKVYNLIGELDIAPIYNWTKWEKGSKILNSSNTVYKDLDIVTLCKLLTAIVRLDRFSDGYLISRFEDGTMLKILKALKYNIDIQADYLSKIYNLVNFE